MHIDHIVPLAAGRDNEPDNLQALCKKCHFVKSKEEAENHEYMKISPTESSFNQETKDIIKSPFALVYAFIETLETDDKERTVYTFDISKCRTNQLYHSNYNFPLFTVMDEPRKYKVGSRKRPGLDYV